MNVLKMYALRVLGLGFKVRVLEKYAVRFARLAAVMLLRLGMRDESPMFMHDS